MTVAQSRVLRVAAWVGAVLLVLTFVRRKYSYRVHPDLFLALTYPMPAVVVVALLAGALVAGSLVYACVEGKGRSRRIVAGVASARGLDPGGVGRADKDDAIGGRADGERSHTAVFDVTGRLTACFF